MSSFDQAVSIRSVNKLNTTRSQERLLGGKKPSITLCPPTPIPKMQIQQVQPTTTATTANLMPCILSTSGLRSNQISLEPSTVLQQDLILLEKMKRNVMKTTQATQTETNLRRNQLMNHNLTLSPRTIHRVSVLFFFIYYKEIYTINFLSIYIVKGKNGFTGCSNKWKPKWT